MDDVNMIVYANSEDPYLVEESAQKEDFYVYLARERTVYSEWSSIVTEFPFYRLYYISDSEEAMLKLKTGEVTLLPGWVYYVPEQLIVSGSCKMLNHIFVHFLPNPEVKSALCKCDKVCGYEATEDDEKLFRIIMSNSLTSCIGSDFIINGAMYLILGKILSFNRKPQDDDKSKFDAVIEYINKNISSNFTLGELAKIIHYNKAYFAHSFKAAFGVSPIQYINNKKITLACKMLSRFDISISRIATNLGFLSEYYFSRLFKQKTGKSPTEYRQYAQKSISESSIDKQ